MEQLDDFVPHDSRPADWDDVLRRASRLRPRRRVAVAVVVAAAALLVAPALAVLLRGDRGPQLPAGADTSRVVVVVVPGTGRVVAKLAPWRGHNGICFAAVVGRSACAARGARSEGFQPATGTQASSGSAFISLMTGYTFDRRVVSGTAVELSSGKRAPLTLSRFPKLGVTVFYAPRAALRLLWRVELRDAGGHVLHTLRNQPRR